MGEQVALITGAGAGIGKACALALAREGFNLVLAGRRGELLASCADEIRSLGTDAIAVQTDVTIEPEVSALFEKIESHYGRLDFLFNNAGTGAPPVPFESLSLNQWQQVVDVNLTGTFLCSRYAFHIMKRREGGRIVNNGSISAMSPRPNSAPYTATKHAITGLTKSLSLDGRKYNIACGQIDIGNALTEMTAGMSGGVPQADGTVAIEPTMDVNDVAKAIVYMSSLSLASNVQFMTVMATKMPLIGRGVGCLVFQQISRPYSKRCLFSIVSSKQGSTVLMPLKFNFPTS